MLQAKFNNGKLITLFLLNRAEIKNLRNETLYCPTCNNQVIIKAGMQTIPHFAHYSKTNCPSSEGGEGPYHEKGKLLLYKWLESQHLNVKLEKYLPDINQRPDLFLSVNNKRIAIEYQCARIATKEIHRRNAGYRKAGIIPIWILGANNFQQKANSRLKVDRFTLQFMHQFNPSLPLILYYLCPNTQQLITVVNPYITKKSNVIGKLNITKLEMLKLTDLFIRNPLSEIELFSLWVREKQRFRLLNRNRLYSSELAWQKWIYEKQAHIEYLPSIIHLPVSAQYLMKTSPWDWQSRICIEIINPLPIGASFSIDRCKFLLRIHMHRTTVFPLIASTDNPIEQYLQLLTRLNIIEQISPTIYKKKQSIHFHTHIEDAIKGDERLMNHLIFLSQTKNKHE